MFLETRDGIRCDLCEATHRERFSYYSVDQSTHSIQGIARATANADSFDVCSSCYDKLIERCKANLGPHDRNAIKCDLCKTYMKGNFTYYRYVFAKVEVDRDRKPEGPASVIYKHMDFNVCGKCNKEIEDTVNKSRQSYKAKGGWS